MRRRALIGYAFAGAIALVVPWNGLRPVYIHKGRAHIAFIVKRHWRPGDYMMADNVVWPENQTAGAIIRCGTCGERILAYQTGPQALTAAFA